MNPIDPASGRPLAWFPERERYDRLKVFCAQHQHAAQAFKSVDVPRNLRYEWLRVEDQGQQGACQGHSLTTNIEVIYFRATGQIAQLSRRWAYYKTQEIDGLLGRDCGSTIDGGREVATKFGAPIEQTCPYSDQYPDQATLKRIVAIPGDARFKIRSGFRVESHAHALQCVAGGMAIHVGIAWSPQFDANYVIRGWNPGNQGGHAIAHCEITEGRLTAVNSWGQSWGRQGRFSWEPAAFDAALRDSRTVAIALSDLATPAPRLIDFKSELFG